MSIKVFTSCCHYHNQASTHHRCPPHRRNNHQLLCQAPIPSSINSTMAAASGSTNPLQTTNERLNCPGCNEPVGDQPVIFAAGRLWYFLKFKRLCFNSSICRHREHFRCSEPKCKRQLDNNYHVGAIGQNKTTKISFPIQLTEKKPFCIDCHTTKQAPRCANESCSRPLKGETYLALERWDFWEINLQYSHHKRYWHPECFRCEGCGQQLIGGQHYVV